MGKLKIIGIALLLLLVYKVSAQYDEDWGVINKFSPTFTLDFTDEDDTVSIESFNLTNSSGDLVLYFDDNAPIDVSWNVFRFGPETGEVLDDGKQYFFTVVYHDDAVQPNYNTSIFTFTIQYPDLDIDLIEPMFGVSPVSSFNFTIRTDRDAYCAYSKTSDKPLADMTLFFDIVVGDRLHKEEGFIHTGSVYVRCNDTVYGKETAKQFTLSVDGGNPHLTLSADAVTEESSSGHYSTTLVAVTNKGTVSWQVTSLLCPSCNFALRTISESSG